MNKIKFSVVIPLYNKANHIVQAVESILAQSVSADEIIVVNDGSTDDSVARLAAASLPRVHIVEQPNQGVSAARNTGIALARNQYIAFLDADDEWLPFFLEEIHNLIVKFPQSQYFASRYQCICDEKYVDAKIAIGDLDPEGVLLNNYFDLASKGDLPFMISSSVIHKALFEQIGNFPVGEPIGEDQDLFARAAANGPIAYSPNIHLIYHRDSENSATSGNVPQQECGFSARLQQKLSETSKEMHTPINRYCAAHLCHLAKLNIYKGRFSQARALLKDHRCNLKSKHKWGLFLFSYLKQSQQMLRKTSHI